VAQPKNLVVLCDGTANQVSLYSHTNLVRLARCLDKSAGPAKRQVVFYDPGLGTEGSPAALTWVGRQVTQLLGLMFGYGLSKNIADAYAFLMWNYEPGDRIYIFGFSRGAYTARALVGLLERVGLLEKGCESLIHYAIKYYHQGNDHQLNFFKQRFSRTYTLTWGELGVKEANHKDKPSKGVIPVHFLGVWDTVKSVGILRWQVILPDTNWLPNMINGRHAVAIDEKRSQYRPLLWDSDTNDKHEAQEDIRKSNFQTCLHQDVQTEWFSGVHADVGGGYGLPARLEKKLTKLHLKIKTIEWDLLPMYRKKGDDKSVNDCIKKKRVYNDRLQKIETRKRQETALAYVSLKWMLEAAEKHGLLLDRDEVARTPQTVMPDARRHNPLLPLWWILGWWKRKIPEGAIVHSLPLATKPDLSEAPEVDTAKQSKPVDSEH